MQDPKDFATGAAADGTDAEGAVSNNVKSRDEKCEDLELDASGTQLSHDGANLSAGHREYLLQRHGTLELDPMPAYGAADPYNWPKWKVTTISECYIGRFQG